MKKTLATLLVVALVASLCGVMFVSAEAVNLAAGKSYTTTAIYTTNGVQSWPDEGGVTLTDGVKAAADAGYGDSCWTGFNKQSSDYDASEGGYGAITIIDLGAVCELDKIAYQACKDTGVGITVPYWANLYVSEDGENYTQAGYIEVNPDEAPAGVNQFEKEVDVSARYVKICLYMYGWGFIDEFEVFGTAPATEEPDAPETPAAADVTAKVLDGSLAYDEAALSKLADGNDAAGATAFSDAGLVSFENKGFTHTDGVDAAVPATLELVRDLGSVQAISKITLNAYNESNSMIALPEVNFYVSVDGVNYYQINSGNLVKAADDAAETTTAALTADFSTRIAVNARYVKAVATFKNGWLFLSELGVTAAAEGNYVEDPGVGYAYTEHSVPNPGIGIFDSTDGELDLSVNDGETGKLFRNAQLIKAKYDAETGAYVVIYSKVNPWPDGHSGTETLGEGEILLAISTGGNVGADNNFSGCKWIARGLTEGDYLVLKDGTVSFYPDVLPSAEDGAGDAGVLVFAVLAVVAIAGCAVATKIKSSAL